MSDTTSVTGDSGAVPDSVPSGDSVTLIEGQKLEDGGEQKLAVAEAGNSAFWLIERRDSNTIFWLGHAWAWDDDNPDRGMGNGAWTFDWSEAQRFGTKDEAEAAHSDYPDSARGRAVEHGWMAQR